MTPDIPSRTSLPEAVRSTLDRFTEELGLEVVLRDPDGGDRAVLYPPSPPDGGAGASPDAGRVVLPLAPREGPRMELEVRGPPSVETEALARVLLTTLESTWDAAQEIRFFTYELSERYEEINLLYSISETLGSILHLDDAARVILQEVCDVLGARRGSLWVHDADEALLRLTASVGDEGLEGPISTGDTDAVTSRVFREGRAIITSPGSAKADFVPRDDEAGADSFLSVPIRYTPPAGEPRTVGVINLIGRRRGGRFTASDQKLLSAIASQVGAALENNRLIQESLRQERMSREMELAHNLQMKLLPAVENLGGVRVAARVEPAEQVGGDFYQLFKLPGGRIGVMIGDVSSHGFPAALIMALAMSAATIYAAEFGTPSKVLRHLDDALRDELETTEMYLTLFYGVLDPEAQRLVYANAGHPHAFLVHCDGSRERLVATDPPVGIAGPDAYAQREVAWAPEADLLFLFTDGLSDCLTSEETGAGEAYVLDTVARLRDREPTEIVEALFQRIRDVTPSIPADDRTAIVLKV